MSRQAAPNWEPQEWAIPGLNAKPPHPISKIMLLQWMRFHHILGLENTARMTEVIAAVEGMYGGKIPNTGDGDQPAVWDVWAFVSEEEKRRRGGQLSLLPEGDGNGN